jgi:hypothetical protein
VRWAVLRRRSPRSLAQQTLSSSAHFTTVSMRSSCTVSSESTRLDKTVPPLIDDDAWCVRLPESIPAHTAGVTVHLAHPLGVNEFRCRVKNEGRELVIWRICCD